MNPTDLKHFFLWSLIINYAFLLIWFCVFTRAHDWLYRLQTHWFRMPVETFDTVNYGAIAFYNICIAIFNLVPFIALIIVY